MNRIIPFQDVLKLRKTLHTQKQKIVMLGGCFDILHIGHISLLEGAKRLSDVTVVLLESDSSILKKKGDKRPLHTQLQRAKVLSSIRSVDYVILLPEKTTDATYDELTKLLQPAIIATTENDPGIIHKQRQAELVGAELVFVNKPITDISTSRIVSALQKEL